MGEKLYATRQKDTERRYLNDFLSLIGLRPDRIEPSERPDFVLHVGCRQIGIEIVEHHSDVKNATGSPMREIESLWEQLLRVVNNKKRHMPALAKVQATLAFKERNLPPKKKWDRFVTELLDFVKRNSSKVSKITEEFASFDVEFKLLQCYLDVLRLRKSEAPSWTRQAPIFVGLTEAQLLSAIQPKLDKSFEHKTAKEYWLLVVSGDEMSKQMGTLHLGKLKSFRNVQLAFKKSQYDRVYLFQCVEKRVWLWGREDGWTGPLQEERHSGIEDGKSS